MTTNTNSAQERTASIDLDAEREAMFAADPEGMEKVKNAGLVHAAMKGWLAARRSLTSGSPADPMYQAQFDGEYGSSVWHDVTEAAYHTFMPEHRRIVYAAPVHDAATLSTADADKEARQKVAEALGLGRDHRCSFTWSYLLGAIRECAIAAEESNSLAGAAAKTEQDDDIRGPLTDAQREECRTLYNNLKHLQCGGIYVADDVIRRAAVFGYMNGRKDFGTPATAAGAGSAQLRAEQTLYEYQPRHENGMLLDWEKLDVDTDEEARDYCVPRGFEWRRATTDQGAQAATTASASDLLKCQKCGADRSKEPCGNMQDCAMIGAALARAPLPTQEDEWQPIATAPHDELLLLAYEFDRPGDWRIKVGGFWNGEWEVFGASWTPTRWKPMPIAPTVSDYVERRAAWIAGRSRTNDSAAEGGAK